MCSLANHLTRLPPIVPTRDGPMTRHLREAAKIPLMIAARRQCSHVCCYLVPRCVAAAWHGPRLQNRYSRWRLHVVFDVHASAACALSSNRPSRAIGFARSRLFLTVLPAISKASLHYTALHNNVYIF